MVSCIDKRSLLSSRSTPNSLCNAGNQIRVGMTLDIEGKYYRVGKSQHVKPGKGVAYVQCDLKEIKSGNKISRRFRAAETVAKAPLERDQDYQFLYRSSNTLVLMHTTSFEQLEVSTAILTDCQLAFLLEGMIFSVQIIEGDVLWAKMPDHVILRVKETTAKNVPDCALSLKRAILENGAKVKVPLFIETGSEIKVATEDGRYLSKL
uniref:Elongation factor P putative n=1 Tax=Albugo laibachii Nc14 TaxID=890382 RepID=F0W396_9STRA|nr:elongation factor P putative [Albugo laibachii Nc14]|eukprot:CCA15539.1 elongation factor P putative [Albugo laibachii Nc14]